MADYLLLEDSSGDVELEDATGNILLEGGTASPTATLTANVAFTASGSTLTDVLVSQVAVEGLIGGQGAVRASQVAVEVLQQYQAITHVGVSQIAVEVLVPAPGYSPTRQVIFVGPLTAPS